MGPDSFVLVTSCTVKTWKFKIQFSFLGLETCRKIYFLGHLQPGVDKNSKYLASLIFELDDIMTSDNHL